MRFKLILIGICLSLSFTTYRVWSSESNELEKWINKYSANNPFISLKKSTPFSITKEAIDDLLDGDRYVNFTHFQYLQESGITQSTINSIINGLLEDISEKKFLLNNRDLSIRKNIQTFFKNYEEKGTLTIAYVGTFHAIDYYLTHPTQSLSYIVKPIFLNSEQYSEGWRDMVETLQNKKISPNIEDDIHIIAWAHYNFVLSTLATENIEFPEFLNRMSENRSSWLIGEFHNINETNWLKELPNANALKANGIYKINVAIEGAPWGPTNIETLFKRRIFHEQIEYRAKKLGLNPRDFVDRIFPPRLKQKFWTGRIQDNPAIIVFLKKLQEYKDSGITVDIMGIEAADFNPLEG